MSGKQNITIGVVKPNGSTTIVNENNVDLEQRLTAVENAQGIKTGAPGKIFVVWTRIGYEYEVTYPLYYINGQAFPAGSKKITLEGSHATLDRTDTFGLNASGAFAIAGNPAAEPIAPTVDTANEIFITTRDVKANTVEPEADPNPTPVADVVVYKQNVEWQTTATSAGTNFNHTGEPFEGTKAIRLVSIIKFKDTVNIHDASQFDALRLKLLQNYQGSGYSGFTFKFLLNDTVVSSSETITSGIDYPFFKNPAVYETVLVDFNRFAFTSNDFNSIEITPIKPARFTGASLIDNVVLIAKSVHVVSSNNTIDTSYFVRKDSFHFNPIDTTGVITDLDISTKEGSGFTFIGTVTELHSLHNSNLIPKYFYGQDFYIKNDQATPFIIKHNSGVIEQERYVFLFPNEEDLEIQPKEIIHFKAIMTDYNGGTLEFVGKVVDLGNLIATAEEKLTIHDDDKIGNADSEDSNKTKFWKFSTIKTNLKTFFDNLYKTWILDIETTASVNYTLSIADIKKKTVFTATNPIALNVPTDATVAIAIGTKKSFTVQGSGTVTVQGAGVTFININLIFSTGKTFFLEKVGTDTWAVYGDNLTVNDVVTLSTNQTISGTKTHTGNVNLTRSSTGTNGRFVIQNYDTSSGYANAAIYAVNFQNAHKWLALEVYGGIGIQTNVQNDASVIAGAVMFAGTSGHSKPFIIYNLQNSNATANYLEFRKGTTNPQTSPLIASIDSNGGFRAAYVVLKNTTVANLPATPVSGMVAFVTDALTPTYRGIVTGGGSEKCMVTYDGTNWLT
ncbi:hypothetical protein [Flavobacterium commune]|uniref:Uncharacterized protein n=1 Tax=Flavobacterium commune TaxID=1306519 RepID=A0A1D9PAJ7_9FLAO|nr:hypothetical protein [Flavobacterium commune]AOZ99591.1 hypothetical protein BIW12_09140 [Flavobacterium commune]